MSLAWTPGRTPPGAALSNMAPKLAAWWGVRTGTTTCCESTDEADETRDPVAFTGRLPPVVLTGIELNLAS
ncbi:hypothetical protein OGATHE_004775 [Ogataea polymorpha]|uniref:Uncharacterized protein n=1 Tax=Ogataea polymorpha TaxID=460523 RepID=A0A9P8T2H9_9ASCO|nr:hypothetical protein OGATHE_004775 [Ogataea polymorpha]